MKQLLLSILLLPSLLFSQTHKISGQILDDSTRQGLPYATIRVDQSDIVTSSNKDGVFVLDLPEGDYALLVTFVGYNSATVNVHVPASNSITVSLVPALIQMPEVAVSADTEDPALEIMRMAIRRREKNYEGLKNYDITGYKKNILFKGDQIAMVEEKFLRHLYDKGRLNKEFVFSTHKTENIKNQNFNINLNVGWALFFVNGSFNISIGKARSQAVFPLADNALNYYDFKLLKTKYAGKTATHLIQVIPRTSLEPLMKGTLYIDDATCAVVGADIETNEGWRMPVVKSFRMTIKQMYANYNGFWIPQYSELSLAGQISALGGLITMDRMELSEVYSSSSCKVNGAIPDSLRFARRSKYGGYTTDTTKRVSAPKRLWKTKQVPSEDEATYEPAAAPPELSASEISTVRPLPLTANEASAFAKLDSSQTLESMFKPKGVLGALSSPSSSGPGILSVASNLFTKYMTLHNNRVEGVTPGAHYEVDKMDDEFYYGGSASYAFGMKRLEGAVNGGWNLGDDHLDRIDANAWDGAQRWQASGDISKTINTIGFTLTGMDDFNYLRSTGVNLGIHKYFTDYAYAKFYVQAQRMRSLAGDAHVSVWNYYRINPAILEGEDHSIQLQCGYESNGNSRFGSWAAYSLRINAAVSLPALGSDFDYQRIMALADLRINTIYSTMFTTPYLAVRIEGGGVGGNKFGIQHMPSPMAALSVYAPYGVLKGVKPYDLAGEKYIAMQAEHNWQALPFLAIGLDALGNSTLQLITGTSLANVWNTKPSYPVNSTWTPYWEAYVGLGSIFDLLRIDCVRTSRHQTLVRFAIATSF